MSNPKELPELRACGNYLGKQRRNFNLSNRGWKLLHGLSVEFGINHSAILEIAIREKYLRDIGPVPRITYDNGREAK